MEENDNIPFSVTCEHIQTLWKFKQNLFWVQVMATVS